MAGALLVSAAAPQRWALVMGGHFHDIAAGTATPKAYEFAWNDEIIAMNQFAGVLNNATEAVAAASIPRPRVFRRSSSTL